MGLELDSPSSAPPQPGAIVKVMGGDFDNGGGSGDDNDYDNGDGGDDDYGNNINPSFIHFIFTRDLFIHMVYFYFICFIHKSLTDLSTNGLERCLRDAVATKRSAKNVGLGSVLGKAPAMAVGIQRRPVQSLQEG